MLGNKEQSLKFGIDSALCFGDIDKKLKVYKLLSEIFISTNQNKEGKNTLNSCIEFAKITY